MVAAGVLAPPVAVAVFAAGVVEAAVEAGVGRPAPTAANFSKQATDEATAQHESTLDWEMLVQNWQRPSTCICSSWGIALVGMFVDGSKPWIWFVQMVKEAD